MTQPKTYMAKTGVRFLYVRREGIVSLRGRRKHVDVWQGLCKKCHAPLWEYLLVSLLAGWFVGSVINAVIKAIV